MSAVICDPGDIDGILQIFNSRWKLIIKALSNKYFQMTVIVNHVKNQTFLSTFHKFSGDWWYRLNQIRSKKDLQYKFFNIHMILWQQEKWRSTEFNKEYDPDQKVLIPVFYCLKPCQLHLRFSNWYHDIMVEYCHQISLAVNKRQVYCNIVDYITI